MAWRIRSSLSRSALALLTLAGGPAAYGQVEFELRTRLAMGWGENAVPIRNPIDITQPGRYDFEFQQGVYDASGFVNYGVANWIGQIHSSEPGLSQPSRPRVAPFDNAIGRDGVVSMDGRAIGDGTSGYIDAAVGPTGYFYDELPAPAPPLPHGAEEYVALYRFSLTITDMTVREITITAESLEVTYTPISGWHIFRDIPPDPKTGEPGYVEYIPIILPGLFGQHAPDATAMIRVVPAPGAGALLALGLVVSRRRRR